MLKGIHPDLTVQVLHTVFSMGHGDTIALVDANFPATSVAQSTHVKVPIDWSLEAVPALTALLEHFPIDTFEPDIPPVRGMQVVGVPNAVPDVVQDADQIFARFDQSTSLVERMAFYEKAKSAFAIIRLAEHRPYGNFLIRKGVVSVG